MTLPAKRKKNKQYSKGSKLSDLGDEKLIYQTVGLFFTSGIFISYFVFHTLIGILGFVAILLISVAISVVTSLVFFKSAFPMKMMEKTAFAAIGVGPFICALFFSLNYFITYDQHNIICYINKMDAHLGRITFVTDNFPCEKYPEICVLENFETGIPGIGDTVLIKLADGLFGLQIIKGVEWPISEDSY